MGVQYLLCLAYGLLAGAHFSTLLIITNKIWAKAGRPGMEMAISSDVSPAGLCPRPPEWAGGRALFQESTAKF